MNDSSIDVINMTVAFGHKHALSSLSLSIKSGEQIALIGPSGAGKTTFLNSLAALTVPSEGEIALMGQNIRSMKDPKQRAKTIGMIRQQFDLVNELPVIHNVLAGRLSEWSLLKSLLSLVFPQEKQTAIQALKKVGLADKLYTKMGLLSGGEQQRVAMARLLLQNPAIILADEPVASLDPARSEDLLQMLTQLAAEGNQTLIASLHSVDFALIYFSRIIALKNGELFFDLKSNEITKDMLTELYAIEEEKDD
jgi:phosphonate transport system ATP-binding protein